MITCLFHFGQALFRKLQKLKMITNKLNKRGYEIIKNLEILCFIDKKNITKYFDFLKNHINKSIEEKKIMEYFEKYWLKKYQNLYNYSESTNDIIKCKNYFINNNGNNSSEKNLISKLKSLELVYFTNNICESIQSQISNYLPHNRVSKKAFKDTLNYII